MGNHSLRSVTFTFVNSGYVFFSTFTTNAVLTICNLPSKSKSQKTKQKTYFNLKWDILKGFVALKFTISRASSGQEKPYPHLTLKTYYLSFISTMAVPKLSTMSLAIRLCSPILAAAKSPACPWMNTPIHTLLSGE